MTDFRRKTSIVVDPAGELYGLRNYILERRSKKTKTLGCEPCRAGREVPATLPRG